MSKIEVNTVEPQCGTTLTLGASGDTVTLGSGASQSGFGRTGTVDWQTTKKTASFTAVSGEGYFVDTSSSAITVTLPASPSAGAIVYVKDYTGTFGTNNCTVARNGSNIRGGTDNFSLEKNNAGAVFIYVDATEGWQIFVDGSDSDAQQTFISATGGTITTCGNFKIHTFTGPGTFTVNESGCAGVTDTVDYLVVAGGGGGAKNVGGGAGAGGYRESSGAASGCYTVSPLGSGVSALQVTAQAYPITVGSGGAGACSTGVNPGSNSVFSTITSAGGGGGSEGGNSPSNSAGNGGSGGGAGGYASTAPGPCKSVGSGNTPPVSPPQGNNGGKGVGGGCLSCSAGAGGGGGATAVGGTSSAINAPGGTAGPGGAGATSSINGTPTARAGGGGGGSFYGGSGFPSCSGGTGGTGGGGSGGSVSAPGQPAKATAGTANTGGGGGGGGAYQENGKAGGSGIVIIRYKFQ